MSEEIKESDAPRKAKPTRPRAKKEPERRGYISRIIGNEHEDYGNYPEKMIGYPLEKCLTDFMKRMSFPSGDYHVDVRGGTRNSILTSWNFAFVNNENGQKQIEESEVFENFDESDFEGNGFNFEPESDETSSLKFQLLIEKEKTKRHEAELQAIKAGSQSEKQATDSALEKLLDRNEKLMMMLLTNAQKPQQDATLQAMNMLEKSFGIVTKARAISDEISPPETTGGGSSSLIADGAKLLDSIGRNAGSVLPMLSGVLGGNRQPMPQAAPNVSTNGNGELSGLLKKAKGVTKK